MEEAIPNLFQLLDLLFWFPTCPGIEKDNGLTAYLDFHIRHTIAVDIGKGSCDWIVCSLVPIGGNYGVNACMGEIGFTRDFLKENVTVEIFKEEMTVPLAMTYVFIYLKCAR